MCSYVAPCVCPSVCIMLRVYVPSLCTVLRTVRLFFQISNKLADLLPRLTRKTFEFWLGLPQGVNVAKKGVNVASSLFFSPLNVQYTKPPQKCVGAVTCAVQRGYIRNIPSQIGIMTLSSITSGYPSSRCSRVLLCDP